MTKFIGDVHGRFETYKKLIRNNRDTIQVGDLGIGFRKWPHGEYVQNPPYDEMVKANAMFIRGNHDNPTVCRNNTQWIEDGTVEDDMMFIGGADSVDKHLRNEDFDWWRDEELSEEEFIKNFEIYGQVKPRVMVTHDCPGIIVSCLPYNYKPTSRTSRFLEALWVQHKPEVWVFGHHHNSFDEVINGTRFVCLAELEMKDL